MRGLALLGPALLAGCGLVYDYSGYRDQPDGGTGGSVPTTSHPTVPTSHDAGADAAEAGCAPLACSGAQACAASPDGGTCATWTFSAQDGCTLAGAAASIDLFGTPCSGSGITVPDGGMPQVAVPCGSSSATFDYDRATGVLYIHVDSPQGTFDWTPNCP